MSLERVSLLFMSVHGGILILVILLLRQIFKRKLPGRTFTFLWCVALVRLLVPCSVSSPFSVYSLAGPQAEAFQDRLAGTTAFWDGFQPVQTGGESGGAFPGAFPGLMGVGDSAVDAGILDGKPGDAADGKAWLRALATADMRERLHMISMGGTAVCGLILAAAYLSCLRFFGAAVPVRSRFVKQWLRRNSLRRKVSVRCSGRIASPLTYGIFRPVILLSRELAEEEGSRLEYILQHEMMHILRCDGVLKLLMLAALCLHWFNPLVWAMCVFLNRDVELACDEEVLRTFGREARKGYALTLIGMEEQKYTPVSLFSGFGKNAVEERIGAIMKYKDKKRLVTGFAAVLVLGTVFFFATSAKAGEKSNALEEEYYLAEAGAGLSDTALMDPPAGYREGADNSGIDGAAAIPNEGISSEGPVLFPGMSYASGEEDDFSLFYTLKGMEESEPAWLEYGPGYCALIPREGWTMTAPGEWASDSNENMTFRVVHFSGEAPENLPYRGLSRDQIAESLVKEGYQTQYQDYQLYKEENDITRVVEIRSNGADNWGVVYTYPSEAEEGFGAILRVMAQNFGILPAEPEELPEGAEGPEESVDRRAVTMMVEAFALDWQSGDKVSYSSWLSDSCQWDPDILEMLTEWRLEELSVRLHPGGDGAEVQIPVRTVESDDSLDYLAIGLEKEGGEWKITWIGLEK